ncbi:TRASH domain-containing protein [Desulfarculales bacterium]
MGLAGGLLRYLLIGVAIWILYRVFKSWFSGSPPGQRGNLRQPGARSKEVVDVMVQDHQCGVYLLQHEALRAMARGQKRFFCSEACRDAYLAGPKRD